jgi:hypothetical protein
MPEDRLRFTSLNAPYTHSEDGGNSWRVQPGKTGDDLPDHFGYYKDEFLADTVSLM